MMPRPNRLGRITSAVGAGRERRSARRLFSTRPRRACCLAEPAQAVLDDDHRAIDDQAEVERAQAHEVAGHAAAHHAGDGHQHRQRNHGGGDQRRAEIPEQQEQHDDHQQRAFDQVLRTVAMVRSTSCVRSYTAWIETPCGRLLLDVVDLRAAAARATARLFSPISMNTVPSTTSSPFCVAAPVRSSVPFAHRRDVADADRHAVAPVEHDGLERVRGRAPGSARAPATAGRCVRCSPRRRSGCSPPRASTTSSSVKP